MWISFRKTPMFPSGCYYHPTFHLYSLISRRHFFDSVAGHKVVNRPASHFYSASKHAVTALIEGHRYELRGMKSHIRVTVSIVSGVSLCCIPCIQSKTCKVIAGLQHDFLLSAANFMIINIHFYRQLALV